MRRAGFPCHGVGQAVVRVFLHHFLQGGLVVILGGFALRDERQDKVAGGLNAAVQEQSGNGGFKRIRNHAGAAAPAAQLLAAAQPQVRAQVDLLRKLEQRVLADQRSAHAGQFALRAGGMVEQIVCHHNGQHTVAQKFQPLVIQRRGFALVGVRAVGQRRDEQFFILKMVMQLFFQFLRGTRGHKIALPFVLSVLRLYIGIFCRPGGQCPPLQWALVLRPSRRGAHCAPTAYILVPAISNGRA